MTVERVHAWNLFYLWVPRASKTFKRITRTDPIRSHISHLSISSFHSWRLWKPLVILYNFGWPSPMTTWLARFVFECAKISTKRSESVLSSFEKRCPKNSLRSLLVKRFCWERSGRTYYSTVYSSYDYNCVNLCVSIYTPFFYSFILCPILFLCMNDMYSGALVNWHSIDTKYLTFFALCDEQRGPRLAESLYLRKPQSTCCARLLSSGL